MRQVAGCGLRISTAVFWEIFNYQLTYLKKYSLSPNCQWLAKMDLLQIAGCHCEEQVRIIQRDRSQATSGSGIPRNRKIEVKIYYWVDFVTYFSLKRHWSAWYTLGLAGSETWELGAASAHRPLPSLLHMKVEARGQRELRDKTLIQVATDGAILIFCST